MTFKSQLGQDAVNVFLNGNEFSEQVTYAPKGGSAKLIYAIVTRQRISPAGEDAGRTLINQAEIMIANDATYGVTTINKGGDKVSLPERIGGTSIDWTVADILDQDEGCWRLLLQK